MSLPSSNSCPVDTLICGAIIAIEAYNDSLAIADLTTLSKKFGHQTVVDSYFKMVKDDLHITWDDLINPNLGNLPLIAYASEADAIKAIELAVLLVVIKKHLKVSFTPSGTNVDEKITYSQNQLSTLLTKVFAPANFNAGDSKPLTDFLNFSVSGTKAFKTKFSDGNIVPVFESDLDYNDISFFKSTKEHDAYNNLYKICQYLFTQNQKVTYPSAILPSEATVECGLALRGFSNTQTNANNSASYAQVLESDLAEVYKQVYTDHKANILKELITAGPNSNNQINKSAIYTWAVKTRLSSNEATSAYNQLTALDPNTLLGFMSGSNTTLVERKSGEGKKRYSLAVSKVSTIANIKKFSEGDLLSFFKIGTANSSQAGTSSSLVELLNSTTPNDCKATGYGLNGTTVDTNKDETFDNVFAAWVDSKRDDDFLFSDLKTAVDIYNYLSQNGSSSLVTNDSVAIDDGAGVNKSSSNTNSDKRFNKLMANLALHPNYNVPKATNSIAKLYDGLVLFATNQLENGNTNASHKAVEEAVQTLLGSITLTANDPEATSPDAGIMTSYLSSLTTEQKNKMKFAALVISKAGLNAAFSSNPENAPFITMFVKLASKSKTNTTKYLYYISATHSNIAFMANFNPVDSYGALNEKFGLKRDTYFVGKPLLENVSIVEKLQFYVANLVDGKKIDSKKKLDTAAEYGFGLEKIGNLPYIPRHKDNTTYAIGQASQSATAAADKTADFIPPNGGSNPGQYFKGYKNENDSFKAAVNRFNLVTSLISIADEDTQTNSDRASNTVAVFEQLTEPEKKLFLGQLMDKFVTADGSLDTTGSGSKNYDSLQRIITRWISTNSTSDKVLNYANSSGAIAAMWLSVIKAYLESNISDNQVMVSMSDTTLPGYYNTATHYNVIGLANIFNNIRSKDSYVDSSTNLAETRVTLRDILYTSKQRRNILAIVAEAIRDGGKTYRLAKESIDNLVKNGQSIDDVINASVPTQTRNGFFVGQIVYQYFVAINSDGQIVTENI